MQTNTAMTALLTAVTSPDFIPWNDPDESTRPDVLDPTGRWWDITPAVDAHG